VEKQEGSEKTVVLVGAQRNKGETKETKRKETEESTFLLEELEIKIMKENMRARGLRLRIFRRIHVKRSTSKQMRVCSYRSITPST